MWIEHNIESNGYLHSKLMLPSYVTPAKKSILMDINQQEVNL